MYFLRESFFLLKCTGLWMPPDLSGWRSWLYNFYTLILVFISGMFVISQSLYVILSSNNNVEELTNILFLLLSIVVVCVKMKNILNGRNTMLELIETFNKYPFKPNTSAEMEIQARFNRISRINTLFYWAMNVSTGTIYTFRKIVELEPTSILPYEGWFPYDTTKPSIFWFTSVAQLMTPFMAANMTGAYDSLFSGLMMQISAQVYILKYRFRVSLDDMGKLKLNSTIQFRLEKKLFSDFVQHYVGILRIADDINSYFSTIVFLQYSLSSIVLCASVYIVSSMDPKSLEFVSCLIYLLCMFYQITLICASGHQTTLAFEELREEIYSSNWEALGSNSSRQNIILLLARTLKPFVIKSGHIVTLDMDSLKYLLKLSYSIYNIL